MRERGKGGERVMRPVGTTRLERMGTLLDQRAPEWGGQDGGKPRRSLAGRRRRPGAARAAG